MADSTEERGRRAFGPTLLLGIPAAAVAVLAASKPLVSSPGLQGERYATLGEVPLALPLAIIPLLCWGVVLVLRGHWRKVPAFVGLFGSLATIAAADAGLDTAERDLADAVASLGSDTIRIEWTAWFWVLVVASLLSAIALAVALRHAHLWPGMSRRYDAPGAAPAPDVPSSNQDLWKAMDEGRDPTAPPSPDDN